LRTAHLFSGKSARYHPDGALAPDGRATPIAMVNRRHTIIQLAARADGR
jgi:hypothetical protein